MILINAKHRGYTSRRGIGYGLLVILINAKPLPVSVEVANGYGLLVILINAKPIISFFVSST